MKIRVICGLLALVAVIASCQSEADLDFKRYYTSGKILYEQKCQNCHDVKGTGLSSLIPPLTDSVYLRRNKTSLACIVKYGIKETIITVNGKSYAGSMPANVDLPSVQIAQILTYVGNSFGNKMGTITSAQVDADVANCKQP